MLGKHGSVGPRAAVFPAGRVCVVGALACLGTGALAKTRLAAADQTGASRSAIHGRHAET